MPVFHIEATVCISISKTVRAKNEADAKKRAEGLGLPDVVSCSPDDDDFWDVGGELDGNVNGITVEEGEEE